MRSAVLLAIVIFSFSFGATVFGHDLPRTLPQTIRVGIRPNDNKGIPDPKKPIKNCVTVDFNFYVKHVLPREWFDTYAMESLKAGAVAIKEFAWYWVAHGGKYAGNRRKAGQPCDADVDNTVLSQVYDPSYTNNNYIKTDFAVDSVWDVGMVKSGRPFLAEYRNSNPGPNRMSQIDSDKQAQAGKTYEEILRKYYGGPKLSFSSILPRPANCSIQNGRNQCQLFLPITVDRPDETGCNRGKQAFERGWNSSPAKIINEECLELPSVALTKSATLLSYVGILDNAENKYALASVKEFIETLDSAVQAHDAQVSKLDQPYDTRKLIGQWGVINALKKNKNKNGYQSPKGSREGCYALGCALDIKLLTYRALNPINQSPTERNPDGKIAIPPIEEDGKYLRVQEMWNVLKGLQGNNDICSAFNYYFDGAQEQQPRFSIERWGVGNDKCA